MDSCSSIQDDQFTEIEFKRYEPSLDGLETYTIKLSNKQAKIISFFQLIRQLVEGANFSFNGKSAKVELVPT